MRRLPLLFALLFALRADLPDKDQRGGPPRDLDTPWTFPALTTSTNWIRRANDIRFQVLARCGLWPLPDRTPLNAQIFGRVEREGYTVEKVHFQPFPGLYVAGNLYRPSGQGKGPFPAVLNPHGHWDAGRLVDTDQASVAARCIQFARMGMVAFSHDMLGYDDSAQFAPRNADGSLVRPKNYDNHVALFRDPTNQLWGLSLMGMQLWDSMRAVDFLQSLPDVDKQKIGCTGESGGGTQTFLLGAADPRVKVLAPVVMVSHSMQGGCWCENAPGLRVDYSNMEFAAAAAPRPQLIVGATGDWTKTTLEMEGPAIAGVYKLLGAEDHFRAARFDFGHNYNRTSREAVYAWFARWLQDKPDAERVAEVPYTKEPDEALRVFPEGRYPAGALSEADFTAAWIKARRSKLDSLRPKTTNEFVRFRDQFAPLSRAVLQFDQDAFLPGKVVSEWAIGRPGRGDRIEKTLLAPEPLRYDQPDPVLKMVVIFAHPAGKSAVGRGGPKEVAAARLVAMNYGVMGLDLFQTGSGRDEKVARRSPFTNHFTTYNRTVVQQRAQDLITAAIYVKKVLGGQRVAVVAEGDSVLPALLASPWVDAVAADVSDVGAADDAWWLDPEHFVPGIASLGGAAGAAAVAAPHPLWLHHVGAGFDSGWLKDAYAASGRPERLRIDPVAADERQIAAWLDAWVKQ